jgi:hypothetical protein
MEIQSASTGFITNIIDGRIIICTSVHTLLVDPTNPNSVFFNSFACAVTGAYKKGSREKNERSITVSLKVLGVDRSADFAVLYSKKKGEETEFDKLGYNFSSRNQTLQFITGKAPVGSKVYSFVNIYGNNISIICGCITDPDIIFHPEYRDYYNNIEQMVTTLPSDDGSSGAAVIIYDPKIKKGVVCGMVQWVKLKNTYTGGLNWVSLTNIYQKIMQLNVTNCVVNETRLDFTGKTSKGYLGPASYAYVDTNVLAVLNRYSPPFANSIYNNKVQGVIVIEYSTTCNTIENSRLSNAVNIDETCYQNEDAKCEAISNEHINEKDIILEINGETVGDKECDTRLSRFSYYNAGKYVFLKCLHISKTEAPKILYFRAICDEYPASLEKVSITPDIKLVWAFLVVIGIGLIVSGISVL